MAKLYKVISTKIAGCTNSHNGATDQVMNDCTWYDENKNKCGDYDTDEFHAYSMCCACKGKIENKHITNLLLYLQLNVFFLSICTSLS